MVPENCRVYAFGVWIMLSKSHPQGLVHNYTCKLQLLLTVRTEEITSSKKHFFLSGEKKFPAMTFC